MFMDKIGFPRGNVGYFVFVILVIFIFLSVAFLFKTFLFKQKTVSIEKHRFYRFVFRANTYDFRSSICPVPRGS